MKSKKKVLFLISKLFSLWLLLAYTILPTLKMMTFDSQVPSSYSSLSFLPAYLNFLGVICTQRLYFLTDPQLLSSQQYAVYPTLHWNWPCRENTCIHVTRPNIHTYIYFILIWSSLCTYDFWSLLEKSLFPCLPGWCLLICPPSSREVPSQHLFSSLAMKVGSVLAALRCADPSALLFSVRWYFFLEWGVDWVGSSSPAPTYIFIL